MKRTLRLSGISFLLRWKETAAPRSQGSLTKREYLPKHRYATLRGLIKAERCVHGIMWLSVKF